jgi:hypothetical protein
LLPLLLSLPLPLLLLLLLLLQLGQRLGLGFHGVGRWSCHHLADW